MARHPIRAATLPAAMPIRRVIDLAVPLDDGTPL
jgi:hypothetical protein